MLNNIEISKEAIIENSNVIECKLPLSVEQAEKIISANAEVTILSSESNGGFLNYDGKAVFTVLYDDDGVVKKCERGVEFSYKTEVKDLENGAIVCLNAKTSNEKVSSQNGIVSVSAVCNVTGKYAKKSVVIAAEVNDDYLVKKSEKSNYNEVCRLVKTTTIEDEFEVSYSIKDVLCHDEKAVITSCEAGVGVINLSGEIEVTAAVTALDSDDVYKIRKIIPFGVELECQDAYPECVATYKASICQTMIKAYVDEGKNKSNFSIECQLSVACKVFENVSYEVICDAYSLENELTVRTEDVEFCNLLGYFKCERKINGEIDGEISKNDRLICVTGVKIENEEYEVNNGELTATGALSITAAYKGVDGIKRANLICPFSLTCQINGNKVSDVNVAAREIDVRLTPSGFSYAYSVTVYYCEIASSIEKVTTSIERGAQLQKNDSAISVLVAKKGETLWDVCKALGASEEEILKYNENVEFPLTGEERVIIFREDKN